MHCSRSFGECRKNGTLCQMDEIENPTYDIGVLWLCLTEILSPTYDIIRDLMSYGRDSKPYV